MTLTTFFRLLKTPIDDKGARLAAQVAALNAAPPATDSPPSQAGEGPGVGAQTFTLDPADFSMIPGSPFAYWVGTSMRELFVLLPGVEEIGDARQGMVTADDFRFVRAWWEVSSSLLAYTAEETQEKRWAHFAKGGEFSPFYADVHLAVDWESRGERIRNSFKPDGRLASRPQNIDYFFRPGLTWSLRTQRGLSFRAMPAGCIFSHKGPGVYIPSDDGRLLLSVLAVVNSLIFRTLVKLQMAFGSYEVGVIQRTPIPTLTDHVTRNTLATLARQAHDLQRERDRTNETTHAFSLPGLARYRERSLHEAAHILDAEERAAQARLAAIQSEIDDLVFDLYGLSAADRELIRREMGESANQRISESANQQIGESANQQIGESANEHDAAGITHYALRITDDDTDDETPPAPEDLVTHVQNLLMWCVGVAFGRWDVRKALDPALLPPLGGPFDPLPRCAPGALVGSDGLPTHKDTPPDPLSPGPLVSLSPCPPIPIAWDGILVDDPTHPSDIVTRVRSVLALLWGDRADAIEREACEVLGLRALRDYFRDPRRGFFPFHIKRYSKSRRKAPIYWLLQSDKRNYAIWLYCHRLTPATLYAAGRDYADAKVALEVGRLGELRQGLERLAGSARKRHEQEIERQQRLAAEVTDFRNRLDAVALRNLPPDLNDGVLISIAPLWQLVPWKESQQTWEKLVAGQYPWSTMARQMRERGLVRE